MRVKDPLIQETKDNFLIIEIKVLIKWRLGNNGVGDEAVLLYHYFEAPDPALIIAWSTTQEQELLSLKVSILEMKETAIAISTVKIVRAVTNNINILTTPKKTRLKESLNEQMI